MIELFFFPAMLLSFLVIMPYIAFIPAAIFAIFGRCKKSRLSLATSALWVLYGLYELGMYFRILCSGECNIRVDLLAIYPLLLGFSLLTLIMVIVKKIRQPKNSQ